MKVLPVPTHPSEMARVTAPESCDGKRDGSNIRQKFLLRLGFESIPNNAALHHSSRHITDLKRQLCAHSYQETLKADYGRPGKPQRTVRPSNRTPQSRGSVSFCNAVTVIPIPSRTDYSDRIKGSLWTSAGEMQEQVLRNCVEFAAEHWDWRLAVEEADMVWYAGQRIHPCHFVAEESERFSVRESFLHTLAAQQAAQRGERSPVGYSY